MKYPRWIGLKGASDSALLKSGWKIDTAAADSGLHAVRQQKGAPGHSVRSGVLAQVQGNPTDQPCIVVDALLSHRLRGFME